MRLAGALLLARLGLLPHVACSRPKKPRYVLCEDTGSFPSIHADGLGELRVFAASIAGGERHTGEDWAGWQAAPGLRAALLLDEEQWEARLPRIVGKPADEGHADHVSYAKCFGNGLPNRTRVACRVGGGAEGRHFAENGSWVTGRLAQFSNGELRQDFAICPVWGLGQALGSTTRLQVQLSVQVLPAPRRTLLLELCRVERPLLRASFCSQPLYGYGQLREQLPWFLEDWLAYHLHHFGFEHAELYDVDGSFAEALEPWATYQRGASVAYHRAWPRRLSKRLHEISQTHPYCAEMWAYAHCVTTHRALSRWVALLHAPDEYMVVRGNPAQGVLLQVLEHLRTTLLPHDGAIAFLQVNAVSFGQGGPGSEQVLPSDRGSVLAASRLRTAGPYHHMPLIDPANCICAGPHSCFAEVGHGYFGNGVTLEVRPGLLLVHHYVEMLPQNVGRCTKFHLPCQVPDTSANWMVQLLRGP